MRKLISSSSNFTSFPCMSKVEGEVVGSNNRNAIEIYFHYYYYFFVFNNWVFPSQMELGFSTPL